MPVTKSATPILLAGVLATSLAGCASLPTSGPTGHQLVKSVSDPATQARVPIRLVELAAVADLPPPSGIAASARLADLPPPPTDMIGPGDILDVTIYEAGVTLFAGGGGAAAGAAAQLANPGVQAQKLPPTRVDDDGDIDIPYAGHLHVLGRTVGEVETMIRGSLRRLSQNPQVIVTVAEPITNTVIVSGEVGKPGRLQLQTNRETLSDVVALAGGYRGTARDILLRVTRQGASSDIYLNDLNDNPALDVRAYPGDRVTLINAPRTFSVLGAPGRVDQIAFSRSRVSLVEAVAQAGGAAPNAGDAAAIFVFRYVPDDGQGAGGAELPVVYHLNMMRAGAYFMAQRFTMRDKDVLYFANARANQPGKLTQLISQLFSPILTVVSAAQTVQNSSN